MSYLRDTVFILRHESIREHDAWVSMYGKRHGKLVGVARGHHRIQGKQIGHMEPLVLAEVMIAEGKSVDKVAVSRVQGGFHFLRKDLSRTVILSSCLSLVDMLTRPGVEDERVFTHIEEMFRTLMYLREPLSVERAQLFYSWFALRLLSFLGNVASFSACVLCREPLVETLFAFPEMGGGACERCAGVERKYLSSISPMTWKLLRMLQGASCEDIAYVSAQKSAFKGANSFISSILEYVPADGELHGYRTISSILA